MPFRVAPDVLARIEALREMQGTTTTSEVATDALLLGLDQIEIRSYESENKRLVNRKLKQRQGEMAAALDTLEASANAEETAAAIATLRRCLED